MWDALLWLYLINATLLINHEIDSAYWQEWKVFGLPGGIAAFLLIHLPLVFVIIYGAILVFQRSTAGLILSLLLSLGGLFAFAIHSFFIKRGRPEFNTPISLLILILTLVVSAVQLCVVLYMR